MPPNLMGLTEIGEYLGVSKQRAHQLAETDGFPEPFATLAAGRSWLATDIQKWAKKTGRVT